MEQRIIANKIIKILNQGQTTKLSKNELRKLLKISKINKDFDIVLDSLLKKHRIRKNKDFYFLIKSKFKTGVINLSHLRVGFVDFHDGEKSVLIPPRFINNAINGDVVKIKILQKNSSSLKLVGKVTEVIKSSYTKLTGKVYKKGKQFLVQPLQGKIPDIIVPPPTSIKIYEDDWVEVEINKHRVGTQLEGIIIDKIAGDTDLKKQLEATIREFDLGSFYSMEMEQYASTIKPRKIARQDLRDVLTLTIDPFDAKDFDDALSWHPSDDKNLAVVGVHIADVASYIVPYKRLHKQIRDRSFTAYLPTRTISMLPQVLVKDKCSLIEGQDKLAHTIMLYINKKTGRIIKSERFHSHIKVDKRLNYEDVQECIDKDYQYSKWNKNISESLKQIFLISLKIRHFRFQKEKFLNLASSTFEIICNDEHLTIEGVRKKKVIPSHNLVEEFMLAANVEVAKELDKKKMAGIFRVHPAPDTERLIELSANLFTSFNISFNNSLIQRDGVNKLLLDVREHPCKEIISSKVLRTMKRALYSQDSMFHYGLGKEQYVHFTSPIRRYSDLLIHLQLWCYDTGQALFNKRYFTEETIHINKKEEKIDLASRELTNRLKMFFFSKLLEENPQQIFAGIVVEIKNKGVVIYLINYGVYSFVDYDQFPQKHICHESKRNFFCPITGQSFQCGDSIKVTIRDINFRRYELLLKPF